MKENNLIFKYFMKKDTNLLSSGVFKQTALCQHVKYSIYCTFQIFVLLFFVFLFFPEFIKISVLDKGGEILSL